MRGRKPKPTALKVLEGNPGKRPLPTDEPRPDGGLPRCPPHLKGEARREWRRMGRRLAECGILTSIDASILCLYCVAWGRHVEAEGHVQELGEIVRSPSGFPIANPWLSVANRAADDMRKALVELGMTPSSRTRLHVQRPQAPRVLTRSRQA